MSYLGECNLGLESLFFCEEISTGESGLWRAHGETGELVAQFQVSGSGKVNLDYRYDSFLYSREELQKIHRDLYRSDDNSRKMQKARALVEATLDNTEMVFIA
ncbi:MAG: hypothetical protein ACRBDI_03050 [Alphaproteobacteria bacterium]